MAYILRNRENCRDLVGELPLYHGKERITIKILAVHLVP